MLAQLAELLGRTNHVVALTGAGISAESGVPTFRGKEGLWGKFKPEDLATMTAFLANPKLVWEWYNWRRELIAEVKPNPGHFALHEFEQILPDFTLITQNVDNLHQLAGSTSVLELHGNIYRNKCADCNAPFNPDVDIDPKQIPACPACGGRIRPDVVWFGEMLDDSITDEAFWRAEQSEVFLSIGTSALVHPAASLPLVAKRNGAALIEVNPDETPLTGIADFHVSELSGQALPKLVHLMRRRMMPPRTEPDREDRV